MRFINLKITRSFKIDEEYDEELTKISDELRIPKSNLIRNIIISYLEFNKEEKTKNTRKGE